MKRDSNLYYCYYKGLVEKNVVEDGESLKKPRIIGVLTRRQAQREVSRPCCVVCEAMEKNLMEIVEEEKEEKEKKEVVEEEVMKSGEVDKEDKGDERGKEVVVVVDDGEKNGGENNGDGGGVVENVLEEEDNNNNNNNNNVNLMSSENFGKCDLFDWGEWNYEGDQIWNEWTCSYPFFWESEYGAYYYWDVLANETSAKEWVERLWQD